MVPRCGQNSGDPLLLSHFCLGAIFPFVTNWGSRLDGDGPVRGDPQHLVLTSFEYVYM